MKILVLGAGAVGTAAAYYLARDGHEVTVIERHTSPADGTSFANGGLVSPGDATAWASPEALKTFIRGIFNHDLGIKVRLGRDPYLFIWGLRFLLQCTPARKRANTLPKLRLALYSRDCINILSEETGLAYDDRRKGVLYLFRSQESLESAAKNFRFLGEHGLPIEIVDAGRAAQIDPGLMAAQQHFAGAVYSPIDQTGDSRLFATRLADFSSQNFDVKFRFNTTVEGLDIEGDRVRAVRTDAGIIPADAIVLAMGPESGQFGRRHGLDLPIYPVKGYAATIPLEDEALGPTMGGVDEDRYVAYSRLGNRLRLSCTAEFTGFDRSFGSANFAPLFRTAHQLFPGAFDPSKAQLWAGLRPMMPNSVPVIGQARYRNLYLNTGHGHLGWTLAAGSGRLLADLVAGRTPEIDTENLLYRN